MSLLALRIHFIHLRHYFKLSNVYKRVIIYVYSYLNNKVIPKPQYIIVILPPKSLAIQRIATSIVFPVSVNNPKNRKAKRFSGTHFMSSTLMRATMWLDTSYSWKATVKARNSRHFIHSTINIVINLFAKKFDWHKIFWILLLTHLLFTWYFFGKFFEKDLRVGRYYSSIGLVSHHTLQT